MTKTLLLFCYDESLFASFLGLCKERAKRKLKTCVILNPNEGPGDDATWKASWKSFTEVLGKLTGVQVTGYVDLADRSGVLRGMVVTCNEVAAWVKRGVVSFWLDDAHATAGYRRLVASLMQSQPKLRWRESFLNAGEPVLDPRTLKTREDRVKAVRDCGYPQAARMSDKDLAAVLNDYGGWLWESSLIVCDFEDPLNKLTDKSDGPANIYFVKDAAEAAQAWKAATWCSHVGFEDVKRHKTPHEFQAPISFAASLAPLS